jgi:hypothetical protein
VVLLCWFGVCVVFLWGGGGVWFVVGVVVFVGLCLCGLGVGFLGFGCFVGGWVVVCGLFVGFFGVGVWVGGGFFFLLWVWVGFVLVVGGFWLGWGDERVCFNVWGLYG